MLRKTILFDLCHNEMLNPNEDDFSNFSDLLKRLDLKVKKNERANLTQKVLENIDLLVIGNPIDDYFSNIEIKDIIDFVRKGGALLLISEYGADYLQKTNLNDISGMHFGVHLEKNLIKEANSDNQSCSSILRLYEFQEYEIFTGIREMVIGGACSLFLNKDAKALLKTKDRNVWSELYNHSTEQWIKEKEQQQIIAAYTEYGQGKVIIIGDIDIFCNDKNIGINALDNEKFLQNIITWLIEPVKKSEVLSFILKELGDLQNEAKEFNKTMNNIIETITILEKRLTYLERSSNIVKDTNDQKNSIENKSLQEE